MGVKPIKPLRVQSRMSIASKNWLGQGRDLRVEQTDSSTFFLLVSLFFGEEGAVLHKAFSLYKHKFSNSIGGNNSISNMHFIESQKPVDLARRRLVSRGGMAVELPGRYRGD